VKVWAFLLLMAGLAVAGVLALFAVHMVIMPSLVHRHQVISMPDLQGLTPDDATARLASKHLTVVETRTRAHPSIPAGEIIEQNPEPGSPVRGGRTVKVVVSSGPPTGAVPDLIGLSFHQAEVTLQREAYRLGRVDHLRRADLSSPTIIFQTPPAGRAARKGQTVDVVLGEPAEPEMLRMPDLRGAELYRARQAVTEAGCVLAPITYERTHDHPPNTVIAQTPDPGRRIRKGERIALVASSR
jgi:beta-lactam-binding protein with PASTA domain